MTVEQVIEKVIGLRQATAEVILQTVCSFERKNLLHTNRDTGELCPYVSIIKTSTSEAGLGWSYADLVNKQRGKEGLEKDFVSQGLKEGQSFRAGSRTVIDTPKGAMIQLLYQPGVKAPHPVYRNGATGEPLDYDKIKGWLPKPSVPKNQGTEENVIVRSPYATSFVDVQIKVIPSLIGYLKGIFGLV